ncbi:phenylacetic acid degradation operon negative regulatory protein PaaX [Amorphus orientalis]|uniref:Phenylacetic acid degradation operon negative regulatory protein n=1 Tax=Amorphus orientalis TaxID=649198 RepID=A0AAE4AS73_9HYPH|nr:phenylacetic acid degradation operon negative regulatory protein PaaX [Amorphus orientalis]MDQ0314802.1 phenylacetic acid degradation operon negative regulatory protein [Amorphus orientalis]
MSVHEPAAALSPLIAAFHARSPIRAWSLIVTIYGDAVVPRGGELWLGTLSAILEPMGIDDRLVRTAMSRLASEGWLERTRIGRKSYYRLSENGQRAFADATRRIYFAAPQSWKGDWRIAVLTATGEIRAAQRDMLREQGFGQLSPTVFLAPATAAGDLFSGNTAAYSGIVWLDASGSSGDALLLAGEAFNLSAVADGYRRFLAQFYEFEATCAASGNLSDLDRLLARILLIHEFRRLVLRDPLLPDALLPSDWPGHAARALAARLYGYLVEGSERWLDHHAERSDGALPPPDETFSKRFHDLIADQDDAAE